MIYLLEGSGPISSFPTMIVNLFKTIGPYLIFIIPLAALWFFIMRPQKNKEKEAKAMRENITVGDEITTIGGIVGKVVMVKDEDQLVIESGSDKTKIRIKKWAISTVDTIKDKDSNKN